MTTFLPDEYKKIALKEYRFRLMVLVLILTTLFFITGAIFTIPTYALLKARNTAINTEYKTLLKNLKENPEAITKEVNSLNESIDLIESNLTGRLTTEILERVLVKKIDNMSITAITIKKNKEVDTVSINGKALTRDVLVSFSKNLEGEPSFSNIKLPVGSLAKNKDISFTISLESKP